MNRFGRFGRLSLTLVALVSMIMVGRPVDAQNSSAQSGSSYESIPPSIDPSGKYLFYLHGSIIELQGRNAVSRRHGRYEYDGIVKALVARGFVVISEVRPVTTTLRYGEKIAGQVRTLIAAGVPAENITVAGFSKGGFLTIVTSAALGQPKVNFVIMAGCGIGPWRRDILQEFAPGMKGRILSLYDDADQEAGSCQEAFNRASGLEYKEIKLKTGLGHGLFYAPRQEWLELVSNWASPRR